MGAAGGEGAVRRPSPKVIDRHATKRYGTDAIPGTRKKLPSIWATNRAHRNTPRLLPYSENTKTKNRDYPAIALLNKMERR
jgi:hypothetical protein